MNQFFSDALSQFKTQGALTAAAALKAGGKASPSDDLTNSTHHINANAPDSKILGDPNARTRRMKSR